MTLPGREVGGERGCGNQRGQPQEGEDRSFCESVWRPALILRGTAPQSAASLLLTVTYLQPAGFLRRCEMWKLTSHLWNKSGKAFL